MQATVGVSLREIARRWGCSAPYVSKFLKRCNMEPLADGSYDPEEATRLRAQYTVPDRGRKRWARRHPDSVKFCLQCGAAYRPADMRAADQWAPKDKMRFCEGACEQDFYDRVSQKTTHARIKAKHLENGGTLREDWLNWMRLTDGPTRTEEA
jgi:transposase-like protein